jgi:hypothetical protein
MVDHHYVGATTMHALKFLDKMFATRGYDTRSRQRFYSAKRNLWQVYVADIVCILTPCPLKKTEACEKLHPVSSVDEQSLETEAFSGNGKQAPKTLNIGTDFIQALTEFGQDKNLSQIILVSSTVTSQAEKAIQCSELKIVHFSYAETAFPALITHSLQPRCFEKLSRSERDEFILTNPRFKQELSRYSLTEPMVKFCGFTEGDIIKCADDNIQSGFVCRYAIVVSRL